MNRNPRMQTQLQFTVQSLMGNQIDCFYHENQPEVSSRRDLEFVILSLLIN